jgi:biopolymer transport protein ExbD
MERFEKLTAKADAELDLKPFINFLVIIIPVLMLSAEFSKISIIELNAPKSPDGVNTVTRDTARPIDDRASIARLTLLVSDSTITVGSNNGFLPTIYCRESTACYDDLRRQLALAHGRIGGAPDSTRICIAAEQGVIYDKIIHLMDAAREAGFPDISIGRMR